MTTTTTMMMIMMMDSLPPLGLESAIFGMQVHRSDYSAKSHRQNFEHFLFFSSSYVAVATRLC
jgi:hypothetical protein